MSPEQLAAFQQGAGGVTAGDLLLAIAMTVMTALTLWTAWVALGQVRAWQEGLYRQRDCFSAVEGPECASANSGVPGR